MKLRGTLLCLALLVGGVAYAQTPTGGGATAPASLALDKAPKLKAAYDALKAAAPEIHKSKTGKASFREGVLLLLAADKALQAKKTEAADTLADHAFERAYAAQLEATGKKPPSFKASYASLTKDALLEPYLTSANKDVPLEDELISTVDRWTLVGFSPSSI